MCLNNKFRVLPNTIYGDPIEGDVKLAVYNKNVFYGYYGYGRNEGAKKHLGYDYVTDEKGTNVIAVGLGKIVQVRIGPRYRTCYSKEGNEKEGYKYVKDKQLFECPQLKSIDSNVFSGSICKDCLGKDKYQPNGNGGYSTIYSMCFGVQVWLKLDIYPYLYAYYAHLSSLSEDIIKLIRNNHKQGGTTTITFKNNDILTVKQNNHIGISGRTGIASITKKDDSYKYPAHLHFECRKDIETYNQISPNNIVKTKFRVMLNAEPVFDEADETTKWEERKIIIQDKWKLIFNNINTWNRSKCYQKYAEGATSPIVKTSYQEYAEDATLSIIETYPVQSPFVELPKEQSVYGYEIITKHTSFDVNKFNDNNSN